MSVCGVRCVCKYTMLWYCELGPEVKQVPSKCPVNGQQMPSLCPTPLYSFFIFIWKKIPPGYIQIICWAFAWYLLGNCWVFAGHLFNFWTSMGIVGENWIKKCWMLTIFNFDAGSSVSGEVLSRRRFWLWQHWVNVKHQLHQLWQRCCKSVRNRSPSGILFRVCCLSKISPWTRRRK